METVDHLYELTTELTGRYLVCSSRRMEIPRYESESNAALILHKKLHIQPQRMNRLSLGNDHKPPTEAKRNLLKENWLHFNPLISFLDSFSESSYLS